MRREHHIEPVSEYCTARESPAEKFFNLFPRLAAITAAIRLLHISGARAYVALLGASVFPEFDFVNRAGIDSQMVVAAGLVVCEPRHVVEAEIERFALRLPLGELVLDWKPIVGFGLAV